MGDVDDADAVPPDLLDQAEQLVGLALGERGGRLVQDQHRELGAERLGDLDHLLLGARQASRPAGAGRSGKAEPGEDRLGAPVQLALVEQAATGRLGAEEQVLLDRHLRHQGELLEHRADPERAGVVHRVQLDRLAAKRDAPGVRAQRAGGDRDQGRLAGAVLAEQDVHLARAQVEIDPVERQHAGKALGDALRGAAGARPPRRASRAPAAPPADMAPSRPQSTVKVGLKSSGASDDDRSKVSMFDLSITYSAGPTCFR